MDGMVTGIAAGTSDVLRVLGFAGSLRARSYNGSLLRAAGELAPAGMSLEIYESIELPLFNEDIEAQGDPEPVAAFKAAIREADALLIATPEYNYGLPAVLKNAIDWAEHTRSSTAMDASQTRRRVHSCNSSSRPSTGGGRACCTVR